jgi:dipeptidyl aminopeptidase/acylaminoacyl peptidase
MKKQIIIILIIIFTGFLGFSFFSDSGVKDDKLYTVLEREPSTDIIKIDSEIRGKGKNNFYNIDDFLLELRRNEIFVTASTDKKLMFFMSRYNSKEEHEPVVLKGRTSTIMNLYMKELSTGKITEIASKIPFITSVSFNPEGTLAVFTGEDLALLYNLEQKRILMKKELEKEQIEAVSWSPDGKKLYLQYSSIPNGGILYTDSLKLTQSYELPEEIFIKDTLDDSSYFGVTQNLNSTSALLSNCSTIIVDKQGNKVMDLAPGIYKDSFKKSVLLKNLNNTYSYIRDFSASTKAEKLTEKVVYDAGFLYDGGLYYITEAEGSLYNQFTLHRLDNTGKEAAVLEISGSSLLLLPDGKKAYVNGPNLEFIDFEENSSKGGAEVDSTDNSLFQALGSALKDVKDSLLGNNAIGSSAYFTSPALKTVNSLLSKANSSVSEGFRDLYISLNPEEKVVLRKLSLLDDSNAEVEVEVTVSTFWIKEFKESYRLKLIKDNDQWKISGLNIK